MSARNAGCSPGSGGGAGQKPSAAKARARRYEALQAAKKCARAHLTPLTTWGPFHRKGVARG
ncbi:hypothetical protein Pan44_27020 [Caulifigura coniformis]|uniref:Uncharacterized protein n=1 Tax=Caulifigura coniformis TaxID=2527983 RepID=A0A517SF02_9PLAN|nr:hypothetical protein [Caulifigura coniformis]QDT54667.1 hypothetical protein Pan44_27020 [Caulifigura coniformis]